MKYNTQSNANNEMVLRAIPDSDIVVGTNCVIYNYTLISKIRHTLCPIHIHQSTMIINQTMIELLFFCSVYALAIVIANYKVITGLDVFTLHLHLKYNSGHI